MCVGQQGRLARVARGGCTAVAEPEHAEDPLAGANFCV